MARPRPDPLASRRSRAWSGCSPRLGITDVRLTGGEPLARREFPRLVAMLRGDRRHPRPLDDHQRLPARARRRGARRRRDRPGQRLDRLARPRSLPRDHPPRRAAAGPARARGDRRPRAVRPIKVNAVAMRDFTEDEVLGFCELARSTDYQVRFIEFMPLDGDRAWTPDQVLTGDELRGADRRGPPARAAAARAARDRPRLPLRRRPRRDRLHQPGLRALLRRLQPDPDDRRGRASHLPVLGPRDRPARAAARRRRPTPSSSGSSATRSGARSSSTASTSPASSPPPRTMSAIGG